jgi:hypothetical protein
MNGVIVGGWQFVWAAYGLTGAALLFYGVFVMSKLREARRNAQEER